MLNQVVGKSQNLATVSGAMAVMEALPVLASALPVKYELPEGYLEQFGFAGLIECGKFVQEDRTIRNDALLSLISYLIEMVEGNQ